MPIHSGDLTHEVLTAALAGLEAQKQEIEHHLEQVRSMLGISADGSKRRGRPPKSIATAEAGASQPARKRRRFSAEARTRMAEAQRKRYAAVRKASAAQPAVASKSASKKRRMSAQARARIAEAARKRWAALKSAQAKPAKTAAKKASL